MGHLMGLLLVAIGAGFLLLAKFVWRHGIEWQRRFDNRARQRAREARAGELSPGERFQRSFGTLMVGSIGAASIVSGLVLAVGGH